MKAWRQFFLVLSALLALFPLPSFSEAGKVDTALAKKEALLAGKAWLSLVDAERYDESYSKASAYFRRKLQKSEWVAMVGGVRSGLGRLSSREDGQAVYTELESGTLVVLTFKSSFETMPSAEEQVTMLLDAGAWRCAGYFVRPKG